MTKYLYLLLLIGLSSCTPRYSINNKRFTYYNSNYFQSDGSRELLFKLRLPIEKQLSINFWSSTNSSAYLYTFNFNNEQKIITICLPGKTTEPASQALNLTYDQFKKECVKEDIFDKIQAAFKSNNDRKIHPLNYQIIEGKRFGINKTGKEFYVIYLNVEPKNVADYNYCIKSIVY
jgi:hypothetical protein